MAPTSRTLSTHTTNSDISNMSLDASTTTSGVALRPVRPFQDRPFKCTYDWCEHRFENEKDMKRHKKTAEDHYYCKKCDVTCDNWTQLTEHKVEVMAPYLEGTKKSTTENPIPHIVCEFCGEDYKSWGGRSRHRAMAHPADQDIECPGGPKCNLRFVRAAHMIEHIERNRCPGIKAHEFRSSIQHKYVVKQIWREDLEEFLENLNRNRVAGEEPGRISGVGEQAAEEDEGEGEDEDGGVGILDDTNAEQMGGVKPLEPEVDLMGEEVQHTRAQQSQWPPLPDKEVNDMRKSVRSMLISPSSKQDSEIDSDDETASQSTATTATRNPTSFSAWRSRSSTNTLGSDAKSPSAWNSQNTARSLFPKAEKAAVNFDTIVEQRQQEIELADSQNVLKARMWHPGSADYKIEAFFIPAIGKYCCPFPSCKKDGAEFHSVSDMEEHIHLKHTMTRYRCPVCLNLFKNVAALVAHIEATQKCGIRGSKTFKSFFSEITGGYLESKELNVPKIYRPSQDLVKAGQSMAGVMSNRYTATTPKW